MSSAGDPRIPPKEMIVTRNKSAQQRRRLRDKDRSMTRLTQLLKSPQSTKTKKKAVKSPSAKTQKTAMSSANKPAEYHPDKLRRRFEEKRVFLRPQYTSETVVKMNKRKLGMPQRNAPADKVPNAPVASGRKPRSRSPVFAELSMEEVVRIVEETEDLDDEDLMEILTCPSPVWWEGPPNENYIEEAICKREAPDTKKQKKPKREKVKRVKTNKDGKQKEMAETMKGVKVPKADVNFEKKQSKLENLLGNIKNKVRPKELSEHNIANCDVEPKATDKLDANGNKMIKNGFIIAMKMKNTVEKRKDETCLESNESPVDPSLNEDKLLMDLENMDIPIETNIINDKEHTGSKMESTLEPGETEISAIIEEKETEESEHSDILSPTAPNMSPLAKRPKIDELPSPSEACYSDKSDLSSVSGHENCDTISDTNIKFIVDEDLDDDCNPVCGDKGNVIDTKSSDLDRVSEKEVDALDALNDMDEFVTVYQIVQGDKEKNASKFKDIPEYSTYVQKLMKQDTPDESAKYDGQLNSFFKKCKNANRKRKRDVDSKVEVKKPTESQLCDCDPKNTTISIAQDDNVKYCLNCSSIFDTDECSYCLNAKSESNNDTQIATNLT